MGFKKKYYSLLLILSVVCFAVTSAFAEDIKILSLPELIDLAVEKSHEIAQTESDVMSAVSDFNQVQAAHYPQVEVKSLFGPVDGTRRPEVRNNRIHDPSPDFQLGIFGKLEFTIMQPVYTFGKLTNRKSAAEHGVEARRARIEKNRNDITLRIKQLYYALVLARQGVETADESEDFYNDAKKRIKRLLDVGSINVTESDLYQVDAFMSEAKSFRAKAKRGENVTYFALKAMIEMPPDQDFEVPDRSLPMDAMKYEDQSTCIQRALAWRPELQELKEGIEAKRYMIEAKRSDRYPSFFVAAHGSLAGAPHRETLKNPYIHDDFNHVYAGIVAGMKWDFDFGIRKARVNKARAEYKKLLHTRGYAEQNIPIEVANLYQEALHWKTSAEAYETAALAARRWIISAFSDFDMGVGTAKNMFDAIEKYGQNRGNYLNSIFQYNLSIAQLENAMGGVK